MWLVRWIKPLSFALLTLLVGVRMDAQIDRITGKNFATRSEVLARHGMVCTSVPAATEVGIDILKRGGSAVDAAIAANATLGLMEPVSNGIGGDLFAIVYSAKENKLYGINGSGRSPAGLSYDQMKAELEKLQKPPSPQSSPWPGRGGRAAPDEGRELKIPPTDMLPISVPGTVDAWAELHKKFGKLKLSDDLAPAIRYAEEGFPVTELIAYYWAFGPRLYKGLPGAFLETYTLDGKGRTPAKGDIFKNRQFHAGQWRLPAKSRFREAYIDLGRPGLDELSWLRRLRASTKRSGHRGTADIKHSRRIRPAHDGAQFT